MADVTCDALITDSPYSPRTHGKRDGETMADVSAYPKLRRVMDYDAIDREYCHAFVQSWLPRVRAWWVLFGDFTTTQWWLEALDAAGLLTFQPVIWAKEDAAPRFTGDGPASQVEYLSIARVRGTWATSPPWGSLQGWYSSPIVLDRGGAGWGAHGVVGAKPERLMRRLVRDYSRPGWTIADPHAGSGTTLVAARAEGRHVVGSERDPDTYAAAHRRLFAAPHARPLFAGVGAA
jgi:hypothetical protein